MLMSNSLMFKDSAWSEPTIIPYTVVMHIQLGNQKKFSNQLPTSYNRPPSFCNQTQFCTKVDFKELGKTSESV